MTTKPGPRDHERDVQDILGLDSTICSGNKWHDPGDGVDNDRESLFPLVVDCKFTNYASFSVTLKSLSQWEDKAAEMGKRFAMPVRLWPPTKSLPADYIVLSLHNFKELLELARGR